MANSKNIEFRVGLIVLLGVALLAASLYWLQGLSLQREAQVYQVWFSDVGTLARGDRVTVSGVRRGKVNDLYLADSGVVVELLLSREVDLRRDARFMIRNLGVMGERYVAIKPGHDSIPLDSTIWHSGGYDAGIPELMGVLGQLAVELRDLVGSLHKTVATDSMLLRFNHTIANLERVSESMVRFTERNDQKIDSTAENMMQATRRLNGLLSRNAPLVDSTVSRSDRISQRLEVMVNRLDTVSLALHDFADAMQTEDGSLQLLLEDRRLYDDLRKTADDLDDLIADIKANPQKYLDFKISIF